MQFNRFLLDNYLETIEGRHVLEFFLNLPQLLSSHDPERVINKFIDNGLFMPLAEDWYDFKYDFQPVTYNNFDEFYNDVIRIININYLDAGLNYRDILQEIPQLSVYLYAESQQFAFPYFYPVHFHRLQDVCELLEIPLPPLPKKFSYDDKCLYYLKLCEVFYEFRCRFKLTPEEFCTLVYGFSKHLIPPYTTDILPTPLKTFITGADPKIDHSYLKTISHNSIHYWQGNIDTDIGDIILMYERAPYSCISSIWRAVTPGYDDPFRYYSGVIWVGNPIKIPLVSLDDLKKDPVWSQKGLVKANMQGVSGTACSREEYAVLLSILKYKNFDISILPALQEPPILTESSIVCERDVEKYLLEPFLNKLGLSENEWLRQMPLRMGRSFCYYPDYVIFPETERGNEKGVIVCEAKYRIQSKKQLKDSLDQAKSYARRLDSQAIILASYDKLYISFAQDNHDFDKIESYDWNTLNNPDKFFKVKIKLEKLFMKKQKKRNNKIVAP